MEEALLQSHYRLDESDPDVVILRRRDGTFVAAFSAMGATREGILEAAKGDQGRPTEANADLSGPPEDDDQKWSAYRWRVYSPECVEGVFSEVHIAPVLGP
jgi:hypothetical protein